MNSAFRRYTASRRRFGSRSRSRLTQRRAATVPAAPFTRAASTPVKQATHMPRLYPFNANAYGRIRRAH